MNISRAILSAILGMGLLETALAAADTHYVAQAGQTPVEPYTNDWPSAASNIQAAVDAATAGDTVLVSNGVYASGTTNVAGLNRLNLAKAITVCSVNGPAVTIIKGQFHSGEPGQAGTVTNGNNAVRCVELTAGKLMGFTLTNGACAINGSGGGVHNYTGLKGAILSNCVIVGNASYAVGGGVRDVFAVLDCTIAGNWSEVGSGGGISANAVMSRCTIVGNSAGGGGGGVNGSEAIMTNCTLSDNVARYGSGGGTFGGTLYNCTLIHNRLNGSDAKGGGAYNATLYNCLVAGNEKVTPWGDNRGGGTFGCILYNCTVVGNKSPGAGGGIGGGTSVNSIVYFNAAGTSASNWDSTVVFSNSCTSSNQPGWAAGNITNNPMFVAQGSGYGWTNIPGNYRLSPLSPCINAGTNMGWMTNACDLDFRPRIKYGRVDMGCYEFLYKGSVLSFR